MPSKKSSSTASSTPSVPAWWAAAAGFFAGCIVGFVAASFTVTGSASAPSIASPAGESDLFMQIPKDTASGIPQSTTPEGYQVLGKADAPVTIEEFSDFQCPYCSRFKSQAYTQLLNQYIASGKARLVFRHLPLPFHAEAPLAATAAECAADSGKFWQYHDTLFANQNLWGNNPRAADVFTLFAGRLDISPDTFTACLTSGSKQHLIDAGLSDAQNAGITGTPSFRINGELLVGAQPIAAFTDIIDRALNASPAAQ